VYVMAVNSMNQGYLMMNVQHLNHAYKET